MAAMLLKRVPPTPSPRRRRHRVRRLLLRCILLCALFVVAVNLWMTSGQRGQIYAQVADVPARPVAIVLGAGPGTTYLESRLDAAAQLYKAGKARLLLVSGAGNTTDPLGSETYLMKRGLMARGVPATAILRDDDGVRTLDSMARAKLVYGLDSVIVVSQAYHLPRAIYLARQWNVDAVGLAADDASGGLYHSYVREWLARVLAFVDVNVLGRQPRATGPPAPIVLPPASNITTSH